MGARLGIAATGVFVLLSLSVLFVVTVFPLASASGNVNANITFNATNYFPRTSALIIVNDTGGNASSTIIVNSSLCTTSVSLTESPTGTFTKIINFITSGTCTQSNLLVADGDSVFASYVDGRSLGGVTVVNRSFFNNTANGIVVFNFTSLGTGQTGNVTVVDNDTAVNPSLTAFNLINVTVNSTTGLANITVTLNESTTSSGIFSGVFTLNASGNGSSGTVLGVAAGDNITVTYNDSFDASGAVNFTINQSKAARNGTVSLSASTVYPAVVVVVTVTDSDLDTNTSSTQEVNVTVNTTNGQMITLALSEASNSSATFTGNFSFGSSSSNASRTLFSNDRNLVNVLYNDTLNFSGGNFTINASANFFNRTTGSVSLDASLYATNNIVRVTVLDNDTCLDGIDPASCANKDQSTIDTLSVFVNSSSDPGGFFLVLQESNLSTGNFTGNYSFNLTGRTNSSARVLNVTNGDNLTVTYTDAANSTGNTRNTTVTATFFSFTTGTVQLNATALNATELAYNVNQTARINLTDTDSFANANSSAIENLTINISSGSCTITFNLTETGANTGIFENTLQFSFSVCSNATRTITVSPSAHTTLTIAYLDTKNGTSQNNITVINTTLVDNLAPSVTRLVSLDPKTFYRIGDTIRLNLTIDQPGGNISANFSEIDSAWTAGAEQVAELGNGSYRINYTIASANTQAEGQKTINITIRDGVGNGPVYTTFTAKLSRTLANTTSAIFGQQVSGGRQTAFFTINNSGSVNQSSIVENIEVFKRYNFSFQTAVNESRVFFFMVPENTTTLKLNATTNNSNVNLTVILRDPGKSQLIGVPIQTLSFSSGATTQALELTIVTANVSGVSVQVYPVVDVVFNHAYAFRSNYSQSNNSFPPGLSAVFLNLTQPLVGLLPQEFNGSIEYNSTNTTVTLNLSYNITAPQMWLDTNWTSPLRVYPNVPLSIFVNLGRGNKSFQITVNNTGNTNLTNLYANITGNFTSTSNLTINITNVTAGPFVTVVSRNNVSFDPLAPNTFANFTITANTSEQTAGVYNTTIIFNSTNGQPYNTTYLNVSLNLTADLNVTVLNVTHNGSSNPAPGTNITINVSVKFQEGEPVTTLNASNFTVYDLTNTSQTYSIQNFNTSMNLSGIYWFNVTVPGIIGGRAQAGLHRLYVEARGPDSNKANGSTTYNMTAPNLTITPPDAYTATASTAYTKTFTVTNNGTGNITTVNVNITTTAGTATGNTTLSSLSPGTSTAVSFTITAPASATSYNVTVNASAGSFSGSSIVTVTMVNASNDSSSSSTGTSPVTAGKTFVHAVSIISYTSALSAKLGETNMTTVTINNSGNLTLTAKLDASADDTGLTFSTNPSACLIGSGVTCTVNLTVSVGNATKLGNRAVTIRAYKSEDTSINDTEPLTMTVLATPERVVQITVTSGNISEIIRGLAAEFERVKGSVSAENASKVESLINQSLELLRVLNTSLASGDYSTAESTTLTLTDLASQIRQELDSLKKEKAAEETKFVGSLGIWVIVGVVVAGIAGLLFYLFLPAQGYTKSLGYNPRQSFFYRLRSRARILRRRRSRPNPRLGSRLERLVEQRRRSRPYKKGRFSAF